MSTTVSNEDELNHTMGNDLQGCFHARWSLLVERIWAFPSPGEIRRKVDDPSVVLARIKDLHAALALELEMDGAEGLSLLLTDWRFKLRLSPIEPEICVCVESRGDVALMQEKTTELLEQIDGRRDRKSVV